MNAALRYKGVFRTFLCLAEVRRLFYTAIAGSCQVIVTFTCMSTICASEPNLSARLSDCGVDPATLAPLLKQQPSSPFFGTKHLLISLSVLRRGPLGSRPAPSASPPPPLQISNEITNQADLALRAVRRHCCADGRRRRPTERGGAEGQSR